MIRFDCEKINRCRLCESKNLKIVIDFGESPLANSYPNSQFENENKYPLTVLKCTECGHIQIGETINPKILFSNYAYSSSDSPSLISHFEDYAKTTISKLNLNEYSSVLEIGSNDGILLRHFYNLGLINLYGVEPASNIAEKSKSIGAKIINSFFTQETAKEIKAKNGKFDIVCANNVFAHVANIDDFTKGILEILTDDGVFIFENAYLLDTIKGLYFDQVYHEHLQYFGIKPLEKFLNKHGLKIFDIQKVSTQGGSFRIFSQKINSKKFKINDSVQKCIDEEVEYKLYDDLTYEIFNKRIFHLVSQLQNLIEEAEKNNKTISCYGCPAKFTLFSKVFNLNNKNIKYVVDDSPLKQNKYSPGAKIPIVNKEYFYNNPTDYCIITAWNMAQPIIKNNKEYNGLFVVPMPELKILFSKDI